MSPLSYHYPAPAPQAADDDGYDNEECCGCGTRFDNRSYSYCWPICPRCGKPARTVDEVAWREWAGELHRAKAAGRADLPPQFRPLPTAIVAAVARACDQLEAALEAGRPTAVDHDGAAAVTGNG
jgi:hypothetical protein